MKRALLSSLVLAAAVASSPADALIRAGSLRPAARAVDADDRTLDLRGINGKPILVLYEDKDSAKMNEPLKADLSRLAKGDRYRDAIALVPVADVQSFDFWPARGFVKSAIRSESQKVGATIYLDWNGDFQRAAGFQRGTSSVLLIGRDARVLFSSQGALDATQRAHLIGLLRAQVEGAGSGGDGT
jgi:hypothetical protein